ncbi:ParB N-terminal domain-containing protein, partial [Dactylosporangium sp. NPDC051485]|uniref:ParB N-terminal domain-containing protein n=1 Tax=Dactylosporangium sp. NPDC051485 TaxID=3154846 RepID=UPI00341C7206
MTSADRTRPAELTAHARMPVTELMPGCSPRLLGEADEHVRLLAESEQVLPPVLVHRQTMQIIDGHHRLRAAVLRGHEHIDVCFFDGTAEDAFVEAVRANVTHGLPLAYADREAAAVRIAADHPHWSDRAIAAASGLAAKTVKRLRAAAAEDGTPPAARLGRDGRVRAVDPVAGRRRVLAAIEADPAGSLREIARVAGVSPSTVREVRRRLEAPAGPASAAAPP